MTEAEFRRWIVDVTRKYVDTPWINMGRSLLGIDCAGLVVCVGREVGAFAFDWDISSDQCEKGQSAGIWGPWGGCHEVDYEDRAAGDILVVASSKNHALPGWLGVLTGPESIVVSRPGRRVEETNLSLAEGLPTVVNRMNWPPESSLGIPSVWED